MIKAVTFDLWHTLLTESSANYSEKLNEYRTTRTHSALKSCGHRISYEDVKMAYMESGKELKELWKSEMDVSITDQLKILTSHLSRYSKNIDEKFLKSLEKPYVEGVLRFEPSLIEGARETIESLKTNCLIGLISNTGRTPGNILRIILKNNGLDEYFDVLTFSGEVGIRKPHRKIFEDTLAEIGIKPQEAVHVGDNFKADIIGAKKVGMKAILYNKYNDCDALNSYSDSQTKPDAVINELTDVIDLVKRM
jgi:putative hydrolase of the HAD superfamily